MQINPAPVNMPEIPQSIATYAASAGLTPFAVHCIDAAVYPDVIGAVSFIALTDHLPRVGEYIVTEDGVQCEVKSVQYSLTRATGKVPIEALLLKAQIYAVIRVREKE